jgi:hypothetical protein
VHEGFFSLADVIAAEQAFAADTLRLEFVRTRRGAAEPLLVAEADGVFVAKVQGEVLALGDALPAGAHFLTVVEHNTVPAAEFAAAVLTVGAGAIAADAE